MANWTKVRRTIHAHGLLRVRSPKSCLGEDFCFGSGWMRSRHVEKVIRKRTKQSTAQMPMVTAQPCCLSCEGPENLATSGRVNPPTMSWAIDAATNRNE